MKPLFGIHLSRAAGAFTAAVGCGVLLGWVFDIGVLKSMGPAFISMKANAAVCFILIGAALWLASEANPTPRSAFVLKACSWAALAIATLTLAQYLFALDLRIDRFLIRSPLPPEDTPPPGRMAPTTALSLILLGSALLLSTGVRAAHQTGAQILAMVSGLRGLLALMGYLYDAKMLYEFGPWTSMALNTALALIASSIGILAIRPDRGPMGVLTSRRIGGYLARRLLPVAVGLPIVLGWLNLRASSIRLLGQNLGMAILISIFIMVFAALVLQTADAMNRLDDKRTEEERRYRDIISHTLEGFWVVESSGRLLDVNEAYCRMSGYSRTELLGMSIPDIEAAETPAQTQEHIERIRREGFDRFETRHRRKDGVIIDVAISVQVGAIGGHSMTVFIQDITERKRAQAQISRLSQALAQSPVLAIITDVNGNIEFDNPKYTKATGYTLEEVLGRNPRLFKSGNMPAQEYQRLWRSISSGNEWAGEFQNKRKDGSLFHVRASIAPLRDPSGAITGFLALEEDITSHKELEDSLRQAQKMESVGRLAGGVAHDFNNLLTAINGFAQFLLDGFSQEDPRRQDALEILAAGSRAATLTRQLLAFSRKQVLNPQVLDLNLAVAGTTRMIKRLIGEDIRIETRLSPRPSMVKVDMGQIDQVLMNLAVNARDAMPAGGTLSIETGVAALEETSPLVQASLRQGSVVWLSVRDTGSGMSEEVRKRIFEPFFTTKEQGKGTGLGLAMVYGLVKQSGGEIEVESAPDRGTTFRIHLPQTSDLEPQERVRGQEKGSLRGVETILLVEDEDIIRRLADRILTGHGYILLTASNGPEALEALQKRGKPVDLLITDVKMPGMSGRELAQELARKSFADRTLFISGYTNDAIMHHGVLEPGLAFLYKPFTPETLSAKVREVLDGPKEQARA